jgi:glycine/D-amino acid oxidase-like deaminating enzyme
VPGTSDKQVDIAVIGAGIAGIATAYYLCLEHGNKSVLLIDSRQPMSFTSAQSGDNYRNWWPHPVMTAFTNDSIDELDRLASESNNVFNMTRGGYVLASRKEPNSKGQISGPAIAANYPWLCNEIRTVTHIQRGGDISGQQLGMYMLERIRERGGKLLRGAVTSIDADRSFRLEIDRENTVEAQQLVNAAGPFAHRIAGMLGESLPVTNLFQQKVAFEDRLGAIRRDMPFSIDLDAKTLSWTEEERELLADDPDLAWLTRTMPGGTHCRPDGGPNGKWVKLGWAYNQQTSEPQEDLANEPASDPQFPEIVMRRAAEFIPALNPYIDEPPTRYSHYGGYYTMTEENWPLIGPMATDGAFMVAALSGFGSMSACAAGRLCASWMTGVELPDYATALSTARYDDAALMQELRNATSKGIL